MSDESMMETLLKPDVVKYFVDEVSCKVMKVIETQMNSFMSNLNAQLASITTRLATLESGLTQARTSAEQANKLAVDLQSRLLELERYSRQDNLIFHGLDYGSFAETISSIDDSAGEVTLNTRTNPTTEQVVNKFITSKLGLTVSKGDISVAHRLKSRAPAGASAQPGTRAQPIIVKFNSKQLRFDILKSRKLLKGTRNVYINEHLSAHDNEIFAKARQLFKLNKIEKCWTTNGVTFIKRNKAPGVPDQPVKISNMAELLVY